MIIVTNTRGLADSALTFWAYNALDCCVTREVFDVLSAQLGPATQRTYDFEMAMQAPAFAMMLRGVAIDDIARTRALRELEALEKTIERDFAGMVGDDWDYKVKISSKGCTAPKRKMHKWSGDEVGAYCELCGVARHIPGAINPRSVKQVSELLYSKWKLPEQFNRKTHKASVDDECLERLINKFPERADALRRLLEARKVRKQIGFMRSPLGPDGRMHSSFNVGATETFRWSSSRDPFMQGCNIQQIADPWRNIFIPDPGMELFYADLEQAESRVVAYDAEDEAFIAVHQSSDTHTEVAKMLWPETVVDSTTAKLPVAWDSDPEHNYRFYAKKIVHGSNLGMTPTGIAREAHIKIKAAEEMQERYFAAFPRVRARQKEIAQELLETGQLTNPLGVTKQFFGRLWDPHTEKEGYAYIPQSMVGFILSIGLWKVWHDLDPGQIQILGQIHDAVLGQYSKSKPEVLKEIHDRMVMPINIRGRICTIPVEILVGPNWRKKDMRKWHQEI